MRGTSADDPRIILMWGAVLAAGSSFSLSYCTHAMDSQITLVAPAELEPAHAKLYFTPDNMRNARVTFGGQQVYAITSAKDFSSTEVVDAAGARVVQVVYRPVFADTIQWRDRAAEKLKEWLSSQKE
jgi:hypothetical protein